MKTLFIVVLSFFIANSLYSQDLIVTNEDDSINCKISKIKSDFIYFTFKHKDEIRSTLIPVANVKVHQFDFYQTSEVPKERLARYESYQHFRFALNGGYSYRTAKISESVPVDFIDYMKGIKSGYHFKGDIIYYFTEQIGFGVDYSIFKSYNTLDNIYIIDASGNPRFGNMSDDITIKLIGPVISTRLYNHNRSSALIMNGSLGYMSYSNDKILVDKYTLTGNTLGLTYDIGYEFGLSENTSLGFKISFISGILTEYEWTDGTSTKTIDLETGEYEGLNRIDFSIGVRFGQ